MSMQRYSGNITICLFSSCIALKFEQSPHLIIIREGCQQLNDINVSSIVVPTKHMITVDSTSMMINMVHCCRDYQARDFITLAWQDCGNCVCAVCALHQHSTSSKHRRYIPCSSFQSGFSEK